MENWKKEMLTRILEYDNMKLLENVLILAAGDDYDGGMTGRGAWEFEMLKGELSKRLISIGFINKSIEV